MATAVTEFFDLDTGGRRGPLRFLWTDPPARTRRHGRSLSGAAHRWRGGTTRGNQGWMWGTQPGAAYLVTEYINGTPIDVHARIWIFGRNCASSAGLGCGLLCTSQSWDSSRFEVVQLPGRFEAVSPSCSNLTCTSFTKSGALESVVAPFFPKMPPRNAVQLGVHNLSWAHRKQKNRQPQRGPITL